jgi:hypothetical protein
MRPSRSQAASLDLRALTRASVMPALPYDHFRPASQSLKKNTIAKLQISNERCSGM